MIDLNDDTPLERAYAEDVLIARSFSALTPIVSKTCKQISNQQGTSVRQCIPMLPCGGCVR